MPNFINLYFCLCIIAWAIDIAAIAAIIVIKPLRMRLYKKYLWYYREIVDTFKSDLDV